jgi:hypothetical protein
MQLLRRLYAKFKLQVNESKSAVDLGWNRNILGYSFWVGPGRIITACEQSTSHSGGEGRPSIANYEPGATPWRRSARERRAGAMRPAFKCRYDKTKKNERPQN